MKNADADPQLEQLPPGLAPVYWRLESTRARWFLVTLHKDAGVKNLDDLCEMKPSDMTRYPGIGRVTIAEIMTAVERLGRSLKNDPSPSFRAHGSGDPILVELRRLLRDYGVKRVRAAVRDIFGEE